MPSNDSGDNFAVNVDRVTAADGFRTLKEAHHAEYHPTRCCGSDSAKLARESRDDRHAEVCREVLGKYVGMFETPALSMTAFHNLTSDTVPYPSLPHRTLAIPAPKAIHTSKPYSNTIYNAIPYRPIPVKARERYRSDGGSQVARGTGTPQRNLYDKIKLTDLYELVLQDACVDRLGDVRFK